MQLRLTHGQLLRDHVSRDVKQVVLLLVNDSVNAILVKVSEGELVVCVKSVCRNVIRSEQSAVRNENKLIAPFLIPSSRLEEQHGRYCVTSLENLRVLRHRFGTDIKNIVS